MYLWLCTLCLIKKNRMKASVISPQCFMELDLCSFLCMVLGWHGFWVASKKASCLRGLNYSNWNLFQLIETNGNLLNYSNWKWSQDTFQYIWCLRHLTQAFTYQWSSEALQTFELPVFVLYFMKGATWPWSSIVESTHTQGMKLQNACIKQKWSIVKIST